MEARVESLERQAREFVKKMIREKGKLEANLRAARAEILELQEA